MSVTVKVFIGRGGWGLSETSSRHEDSQGNKAISMKGTNTFAPRRDNNIAGDIINLTPDRWPPLAFMSQQVSYKVFHVPRGRQNRL
jgi:hypothetical protein